MNHAGSACPPAGRIVIITIIACQIVSTLQASHGPALYHKQNSVRMDGKPFQPGEKAVALVSPEDDHDHFTPAAWKKPLSTERKVHLIRKACQDGDLGALVKLATTPGGLIHDDLRKLGWPVLLGSAAGKDEDTASTSQSDWRSLPEHKSEQQVQMDVDRSFVYYPHDMQPKDLEKRKLQLSDLINEVLRRYLFLHYFQGFHDICQVFLLVLGPRRAVAGVARLCLIKIRDFMLPLLSPALSHLLLLPEIVQAEDDRLGRHVSQTQPFFALSATLTLYAHDIQAYSDIARLFDVLLAREPAFSLYLFATIILERKEELLEIPPDEPDMLYSVLSKVPQSLNLDELISTAAKMQDKHPPELLPSWRNISRHSVLKTARVATQAAKQSSAEGTILFEKQVAQLKRLELCQQAVAVLHRYQRPAVTVGLAIVVGIMAWRLRANVW